MKTKQKKKRKLPKRKRGEPSALFRVHKNFEESSLLLKKVREHIQTDIDSGKLRGKVKEKMEAFILLTTEVDKTVSAYDMLLKEYFNIGGNDNSEEKAGSAAGEKETPHA